MRYKGDYFPSYLLDPVSIASKYSWIRSNENSTQEKYSWHPLQPVVSMLDKYRYVSFANPEHSLEGRNVPAMGMFFVYIFKCTFLICTCTDLEYEISDEEALGIWCEDDSDGCQPLKASKIFFPFNH